MKIVSTTPFSSATAAATTAAALTELGEHAAGDWIFVCAAQDGGGTLIEQNAGTTGWADTGTQGAITGTRGAVFSKKAASASETVPVFKGATDEWTGQVVVIRGLDATTAVAAWQRVDWTGVPTGNSNGGGSGSTLAASSNGGAAITYSAACMMLVFAESDTGPNLVSEIGVLTEIGKSIDAATVTHLVGYKLLQGSGTVPNVAIRSTVAAEGGNIWTLLLTPASTDDLIPFAESDVEVIAYLGNVGAQHDQAITWADPTTRIATIDSLATSNAAITRTTAALAASPWGTFTSWSCAANLGAEAWVGEIGTLPTPIDVSGKLLALPWATSNLNATPTGTKGVGLYIEDASGNWSWFALRKRSRLTDSLYVFVVDPASGTRQDGSATRPSTIKHFGLLQHRLAGSTSARLAYAKLLLSIGTTTLIGGGTSDPAGWQAIADSLSSWGALNIARAHPASSDQFQVKSSINVGDGTNSLIASVAAMSCAYPGRWNPNSFEMTDWNVGVDALTLNLVGGGSSVIDMSGCLISADAYQQINFNVSASFAGTLNASGLTLGGYTLTDSKGLPWSGPTFKGGDTVTIAAGGDMTNATISKTTSTNAPLAITGNGSVLTGCTTVVGDVSGLSTAYHAELGTGVKEVTLASHVFTGAAGTNKIHALKTAATVAAGAFVVGDHYEIKTVGTTDFTAIGASANTVGVRFTATGAGSGTGDAYAAVKITISGTTSLAESDVTSAGAKIWVAAPELYQEVAITGLAETYRLQLFDIEYDLTVSGITVTPTAGATYTHNGITWTVRSASITAGAGTITVYGTGTPAASGTLTKTAGTGDASITFSAYAVDGTELYIGVPGATSYTWTDSVAAAAPRVIRVRVMEDGPGTGDAILMIDAIVGMCGITDGTESVGYLVAAVADDVYNDRGVDGSAITGITIDDTTLRLEIASGTIVNYGGTDVLVVDGRDLYAYETYWLGTTAGMRDEARFIEAVDAVNFRCSGFKLLGTSGYPIAIRNCFMVDAATGVFASMVDYSGDPISNHPEHMAAIVVSTSDSVVTGTLEEFIAAVPTAATNAEAARTELAPELAAILRTEKFARNKAILNPATGARIVYDNDGATVLGQGNAYMDADGTQLYDGTAPVHRTERLA